MRPGNLPWNLNARHANGGEIPLLHLENWSVLPFIHFRGSSGNLKMMDKIRETFLPRSKASTGGRLTNRTLRFNGMLVGDPWFMERKVPWIVEGGHLI